MSTCYCKNSCECMKALAFSIIFFFFSSRRRHTRCSRDWSSDVCSSDLAKSVAGAGGKWKFDKEHRFLFVDKIFGGAIPKEFIPPIEVGIREAMDSGPLAGFMMVDVAAVLVDGSYHDVDSSEMAFKIAGSMGFKEACARAKPVLLEPIMKVEVV